MRKRKKKKLNSMRPQLQPLKKKNLPSKRKRPLQVQLIMKVISSMKLNSLSTSRTNKRRQLSNPTLTRKLKNKNKNKRLNRNQKLMINKNKNNKRRKTNSNRKSSKKKNRLSQKSN